MRGAADGGASVERDHFNAALTSENSALSRVPRLVRTLTSTIARSEAIKAYSIAVAPELSDKNWLIICRMFVFLRAFAPSTDGESAFARAAAGLFVCFVAGLGNCGDYLDAL
jgi:hypothetical protein